MTNIAKSRRGQFIVAAAMFIALIMLAMALMIYSAGSRYQTLEKEPVREIVQTITDDFKRILTIALVDYNNATNKAVAEGDFRETVFDWSEKTTYCYLGMGLQLKVSGVQPYYNIAENSFEVGANATLNLNITSIGFYGYEYPAQVKLNVALDEVFWYMDNKNNIYFLYMIVNTSKEGELPVLDLDITRLNIAISNSSETVNFTFTKEENITEYFDIVRISGSGIYAITLEKDIPVNLEVKDIEDIELNASLEFIDGRGINGSVRKQGNLTDKIMHVKNIDIRRTGNKLEITVHIVDINDDGVRDAKVSLQLILPNGSGVLLQESTKGSGRATFEYDYDPSGDYTAIVVDVVKEDWFYDYRHNIETAETYP